MTSTRLPKPDKPYPDWARFLKAVWMHGMNVRNIDPMWVDEHVNDAVPSIKNSMIQRNEAQMIRPSSFVACARQTYFAVRKEEAGKMPDNIGTTYAVGHLLHELSYAAVRSAIPSGFQVETEKSVALPDWWPDDYKLFNQQGHVDMLITQTHDKTDGYLNEDQPTKMLIDFKTMGGFSYKKHGKTVWGEDPDGFGYLAQLAIYSSALGVQDNGALLAGINRDSLTQPLLPRFISPQALKDETNRLKVAFEMALEGSDPGEEFLVRHDRDAHFFCGRNGKPGYCPFKGICGDNPTREDTA